MAEHFCQEHNCQFYKNEKNGKVWYSHKKKSGGYCNEPKEENKEQLAISTPADKPIKSETASTPSPEMSKNDWAEKDRITRKSIERQTALNAAVEISRGAENLTPSKITKISKIFELYLDSGQIIEDIEIPVTVMNAQQQGLINRLHEQKGLDAVKQAEYAKEKYKLAEGQKMNFNNAKDYIEHLNTLPDKK